MQLKYAVLHCSYAAPIRVSVMVAVVVVAARETVCFSFMVAARDVLAVGRTTRDVVAARDDVTDWAAAARDVLVRVAPPDCPVRPDTARWVTVPDDWRDTVGVVAVRPSVVPGVDVAARPDSAAVTTEFPPRFVVFSSRTAASATPMQIIYINTTDRIFLVI